MFNQDTFSNTGKVLIDLTSEFEMTLILKIAKSLGKGKTLSDDDWRLMLLSGRPILYRSFYSDLLDTIKKIEAETSSINADVVKMALNDADKQFKNADYKKPSDYTFFAESNNYVFNQISSKLNKDITKGALTMLANADAEYVNMINKSIAIKESGAITRTEAVKKVLSEWAESGVPSLIDKAGRRWQSDVYVNMVTRTNSLELATEAQNKRAQEYGYDLILTSQHADQSNQHAPYANKIYSLSGNDKRYPPFSEALNATFMNRPNCRHTYSFYFPKVTSKPDKLIGTDKNYALSQQQRKLERDIRAEKRKIAALEQAGFTADKSKLSKLRKDMSVFIDESGRTRRRVREQI